MRTLSLFRAILAGVVGLVIGVVFAALVNLAVPAANPGWNLFPICLAAVLSALGGYLVGARQKIRTRE
jgi:small basic protein